VEIVLRHLTGLTAWWARDESRRRLARSRAYASGNRYEPEREGPAV